MSRTNSHSLNRSLLITLLGGHCDGSHPADENAEAQKFFLLPYSRWQEVSEGVCPWQLLAGSQCNSGGILLCTRQASWQGAVHPQLTSSRQVRMRTLLLEARTNGPGGLTTSEGDLEHPVTPHMTLLKTEQQPPTEVLREVKTSRGTGRERK